MKTAVKRAEELGAICAGEAGQHSHAASQLRPAPADERHPHQLLVTMAGALVDSDDTYLSGAGARPDGESGDGAVNLRPIQSDVTNCPTESLVKCNAGPRSQTQACTMIGRRFPSPLISVSGQRRREGANRQVSLCQCPELRRSTTNLARWGSQFRAETADSAADPREVGIIG